jgi:DNA recombination protein RmuC
MSYDLMEKNNRSFFELAKSFFEQYQNQSREDFSSKQKEFHTALAPLKESIEKMDFYTRDLEKQRQAAYASLSKQLDSLVQSENLLRTETHNLSKALKSPNIRGAWGQIHLRRVIELSGMLDHCDFFEQKTIIGEEKVIRPDVLIQLPQDRSIIIDAKTPIDAYLEAMEINDEKLKKKKLKEHAMQVKKQIKDLSQKEYWKEMFPTLDFVILFLPAEAFFSAALLEEPLLLETAAKSKIVLATPSTLIAILRAIALSWNQQQIAKNTKEIIQLGQKLYERLSVMNTHFSKLGKNLSQSVDAYNQTMASYETRVLVSARKLKDLGLISENNEVSLEEISKSAKFTLDTIKGE